MKWLQGVVFIVGLALGTAAQACMICAPASGQPTLHQRLFAADAVVLAQAALGSANTSMTWTPLSLVKGPMPTSASLQLPLALSAADSDGLEQAYAQSGAAKGKAVHVLLYIAASGSWRSAGALGRDREAWLKRMVAMPRALVGGVPDAGIAWPARLAGLAPDLESPEPLVAQTTYEEISVAPYAAMRSLKPLLNAQQVNAWLDRSDLQARRPLYGLLLGVSGTAADARQLEARMQSSLVAGGRGAVDAEAMAALSAYVAAYLELLGDAGLPWLEQHVLQDTQARDEVVQAVLQAMRIHAEDGVRVRKARVVQAYALYIKSNPARAGFVASDLSKWERWEFTDTYVDILKSRSAQVFSSRYAIVFFLMRSPVPQAAAGLDALRAQGIL